MKINVLTKMGIGAAGLVAGAVLASTVGAQAATPSPAAGSSSTPGTAADPHPGDNGADGVPEAQEHHGGRGGRLDLAGTVTAVGASSVTIRTATGTTQYAVTAASDIDKNGEAALKDLAAGDTVTFSVQPGATQIDKLHAGDEARNMPAAPGGVAGTTGTTGTPSSGA